MPIRPRHLIQLAYDLHLLDLLHRAGPSRITVLAYHRINDADDPAFDLFTSNVSATPEGFEVHMEMIGKHFNVISPSDFTRWVRGEGELPRYPLLITFDDGYRDNMENAAPILARYGFPAVIFLATDYIGESKPFYWDLVAACFHYTALTALTLPDGVRVTWTDVSSRKAAAMAFINQLKRMDDGIKWQQVHALPAALEVEVAADVFAGVTLTWDEAKVLQAQGIEMGGHTQSHPILTRVSIERAREEIAGAKVRVEAELGTPCDLFAYPNGLKDDINEGVKAATAEAGYAAAFTLISGPDSPVHARRQPMAVRRVYIGMPDAQPSRLAAKLAGLARLQDMLG